MRIQGVFIGVNKHLDPGISELTGACHDANAMWALFADSIPHMSAQLLTDASATCAAASNAILSALSEATDEDVVIISFAGHGSSDGRLVMHDTLIGKIDETTLSMAELADAFASTRARAVLCILDCCFSGQAPARVLETDGRPRSMLNFGTIFGEGRVLLTACGPTESAWEQPGGSHGLLTFAIIEAFTDPEADTISFPEIAGEIIRVARVAAERMGRVQTPEFVGRVQGGLTFPTLKRGENFAALFPPTEIRRVSGEMEEFADFGVPAEIVTNWAKKFPTGLNALQLRAVNDHGILAGESLLVVAPTSSGKTMIGEIASIRAVLSGKKAVFLLPYRALVNEKYLEFSERYSAAGLRVLRCSGDASDGVASVLAGRYDLAFFTYEMFLNLALVSPRLLHQLDLVVVDEGQFITDPGRGITVELILALLLRAREGGIDPQLIILSAVIGQLNDFDGWLSIPVLRSEERPVPLIEGVLDRRGTFQFRDIDGSARSEVLLDPYLIVQRGQKPSAQDVIVPLARQLIGAHEKLLIFRNMRGPAQGCAKYLARELGLPPASEVLASLPTQDPTRSSEELRECLAGGTAFHNTNLLRAEREAIEAGFRDRQGKIEVLAATTTLAAGINTPASTVILAENEFVGEDGRPFTIAEYKNMAGRAGRLGWNETGKAIILAETPIDRARLFQKYVMGTPEDVTSSFQRRDLATWTMRLLSQVRRIRADEIPTLLVNTFGGFLASRSNPDWVRQVTSEVVELTGRLVRLQLAEQEGDLLHLTLLGQACGSSSLSFESSLRLVELLQGFDPVAAPPIQVVALVQVLDELDALYTPVMKRGRAEAIRPSEVASRYGNSTMHALQRFGVDEIGFWRRCKRAALVYDWLDGAAVEDLETRYTANIFQGTISYGDIIRITDGTRYHLRSAHQILAALFPQQPEFLAELDVLLERLEFGLPEGAIILRQLPISLTRGQYLALHAAGVQSIDGVADLSDEKLVELIGAKEAALLRRSLS
ncbi:MAG: DEAD/DEAH box helicase [Burkholderiales bacterium]